MCSKKGVKSIPHKTANEARIIIVVIIVAKPTCAICSKTPVTAETSFLTSVCAETGLDEVQLACIVAEQPVKLLSRRQQLSITRLHSRTRRMPAIHRSPAFSLIGSVLIDLSTSADEQSSNTGAQQDAQQSFCDVRC